MRRILSTIVVVFGLAATLVISVSAHGGDETHLHDWDDGSIIEGSKSKLDRDSEEGSVEVEVDTALVPGNAYTIWGVIFNNPSACSDQSCGVDDIFIDGDPAKGPNTAQREAAEISVLWLDGEVADGKGEAEFQAKLYTGKDGAPGDVLFGNGLTDVNGADIHIVVRDHGPASDDPDELEEQLTTLNGGCPDGCPDVQFSVHESS